MRKEIYLAVIERLKQITDAFGAPIIEHFDLWNQNVEFIEQETSFPMPAVFVEFEPIAWVPLQKGVQQGALTIRLHIVTEQNCTSEDGGLYQDKALDFLDLLDQINNKLSGMKADNYDTFTRVSSATNHNHEQILESIEIFQSNIRDKSGMNVS